MNKLCRVLYYSGMMTGSTEGSKIECGVIILVSKRDMGLWMCSFHV